MNPGPTNGTDLSYPSPSTSTTSTDSTFTLEHELKSKLSIINLNVQSLLPKIDLIKAELSDFDVLSFTESWLKPTSDLDDISISGFSPPYNYIRQDRTGGGVSVYVKENIHSKRRDDLEADSCESVWIEMFLHNRKVLLGTFYRPPNSTSEIWDGIKFSIEKACNTGINTILVTGDFNCDQKISTSNDITDICDTMNFSSIINEPTHFTETSQSILDLILTNSPNSIFLSGVGDPFLPNEIRYHCPVYAFLNINKPKRLSITRKIWLYKEGDYDAYRNDISNIDIDNIINNDPNESANRITDKILEIASCRIPNKIVTIRKSDYPWINSNIRKEIRKRKRAHKRAKRTKLPEDWSKFRRKRNEVINLIRKTEQKYMQGLVDKIHDNNTDSRQWWKTVNKLTNSNKTDVSIPSLNIDNTDLYVENDKAKTELFNTYFLSQQTIDDDNTTLPDVTTHPFSLCDITIDETDVTDVLSNLNISKATGPDTVFCDISKAFDRVWHKGLIHKLQSIGINGEILNWFSNYLSCRKQRVVINGEVSGWGDIKAGVPQGSILGPVLFLIYINDIVKEINTNIRLFADDTSLYIIVDDPLHSAEILNSDLEKIHHWSRQWLVDFNPNKTESLLISNKQHSPFHPALYMNDTVIKEVEHHKHLGITFTSDLSWDTHIDSIAKKASKKLHILRKLRFVLDRLSLQKIYFSFIRPVLEYADIIWDGCTQNSKNRFYSLIQHAKTSMLDEQRRSGILSHKIMVNGVRIHFETSGDGQETLLLLPGALGSSRTDFEKQLSDFNKKDYTLIAFDPRGYGKSIPPKRDWPLEFLQRDAEDAYGLCEKLGLTKVSVLGWSDGGITGMILAARYPDLVNDLVIWGANAYITKQDMECFEKIRDISKWSEAMRTPFMALYGEEYFKEQWSNWVDAYANYYSKRNGDICMDDLKHIKARTLILHGLKDPLVPLEHPDYLHHHIKGSKLYILPEGKHNLHIRYYREVNYLIEHFLKKS
ncbi:hypothetical protein FSP39_008065 [Pinctada imbricata]|uniref:Reverse transcriptase domain-containing protein n=1 Tax=Pinctada imbricata TaxID=66713 RepID=A0AA89BSH2_PINIB|nr:hypothetical protein FSP39_008065 [Pinctada imbricata]